MLVDIAKRDSQTRLIWVDSADVESMRSILRYCELSKSTIHVGQCTGKEVTSRVMSSEGWLGTTLSETRTNCDMIIALGQTLLSSMPRLVELLSSADGPKRWIQLGPQSLLGSAAETEHEHVPVENDAQLYRLLTSMLELHAGMAVEPQRGAAWLLDAINSAEKVAIVLDVADVVNDTTETCLRRLTQLARAFGDASKVSLLCLDSKPGRVTAEETLRWLTGHSPTARAAFVSQPTCESQPGIHKRWHAPEPTPKSLEDWREKFDFVCTVRTIPADEPLPNLNPDLSIIAEGDLSARQTSDKCVRFTGSTTGLGYLFRADGIGTEQVEVSKEIGRAFERAAFQLQRDVIAGELSREGNA